MDAARGITEQRGARGGKARLESDLLFVCKKEPSAVFLPAAVLLNCEEGIVKSEEVKIGRHLMMLADFWCGRWDLNPHVYGWTQAPQACLSTDSSTPAYAYALVKCMSYYNRYARNVNHKFSTQVDFFVFLSAAAVWRVSVTRTAVRTASAAMSASAPSAIGSR